MLHNVIWTQVSIWMLVSALFLSVGRSVWPSIRWLCRLARATTLIAIVLLAISVTVRSQEAGYFALSNMYESMMMVVLTMLLGLMYLDFRFKVATLAWPVILLALIALNFALTLPTDIGPLQAALQSYWRSIHVPVIIASYGFFTIAFITSLLHLVALARQSEMRQVYDEVTHRAVAIGFPLLAIGVILGGLWANEAWGNYWSWDPKESMSLVTLLIYGAYLHLRVTQKVSSTALAWISVGGFVMMLITYFGVNIMGLGLHSYGKIG